MHDGRWHYYLADGLGSTMVLPAAGRMDAAGDVENGYTYDPSREGYGEPTVTGSLANEFDFAGQQTDGSTGLQYLRARYYDPATGGVLVEGAPGCRTSVARGRPQLLERQFVQPVRPIRFGAGRF